MTSITSTGVGSGLDVNTIVTSLMALEKRPLTMLQVKATTMQTKLSAFGTLKGQLAALGDVATRLAAAANWNPLQVDSSNSTAVSATASSSGQAGKHTLAIGRLAQSQALASGTFASSAAVVGTGTLKLEIGTTAAGVFTPKAGSVPATITITPAAQSLAGVRDAINAAGAGVSASIVNSGGTSQLVLRGADGADSSIRLTATDDDGNNTDVAGLSALAWDPAALAGAGKNLSQTQAALDAQFTLDGLALTSASNTPSDVLEGVTLSFKQVTTADVSLSVTVQTMAVRKNINDFIGAYNSLNKLLQSQTQADPSGKANGPLQADSTAVGLLNSLRDMLHGSVSGLADPSSLAIAGIELQRDGSLSINEARLAPLLDKPAQLAQLFSQVQSGTDLQSRGFGLRFSQWAKELTGDNAALAGRVGGLQRNVAANQKQQDVAQERLERTEARLRAQYQRLDSDMSRLNARFKQMSSSLGLV
jgi:flagellar hook-associated protein 2